MERTCGSTVIERMNKKKKKRGNEEGGRQMQRQEEEGAIAESCELNEL